MTDNTLYAVGQTAMVGHNISALGVKGLAKRTAKDAGKALVYQYDDNKKPKNDIEMGEEAILLDDSEEKNEKALTHGDEEKKPL